MSRKIRMGMVGGGQGAFIGAVHRAAAALDGSDYKGNRLRVNEEKPRPGGKKKGRGRR